VFGHDWEPAQATIVATHVKGTSGDGAVTVKEFAADVVPASGAPFRALIPEPRIATDFWPPSIGDVVKVHADVARRKAKFDKSDPRISYKAHKRGDDAQFKATLAQPAPPGAAAPPTSIKDRAADAEARLSELRRIKDQGLIDDAEYEDKRRSIIREL
jgi:hypothetical protein